MILELRKGGHYYDTEKCVVYELEFIEDATRATVNLYGPGYPEIRQERIALDRAGNWENQKFEEFAHNEPFYSFVGSPARRLAAWLVKQVAHPVTSRDGSPEGILDGYVKVYLDGESAPRQADDDPPVALDRGW